MSSTAWTVITAVSVLGIAAMYVLLRKPVKALAALCKGYQPPQLRFGWKKEDAFAGLEDEGMRIVKRFGLLYLPMLVFVSLALAVVALNAAQILWMRHAMYAFAAGGCLLGAAETLMLSASRGLRAASVIARIKWALLAVWTLGMFAGLVMKGWAL